MEKANEETLSVRRGADLLHCRLWDRILLFALPIAASSFLQQLFNAADVAVAGHFADGGALAAVGSNAVLAALFVNLFVGLSVGVNAVISLCIGNGHTKEVSSVIHTAMLFSFLCGIVIMVIGIAISRPVLIAINVPDGILDRALLYLRIYCTGLPFLIPFNFGAAILRSVGDTKRPMYCLSAAGLINVCLNLLFVIVFHLDVAGVALSTVISSMLSAAAVVVLLCHETGALRLDLKKLRIDGAVLARILRIGAPAAIQSAVFSFSNICLQSAINTFGSDAMSGMTVSLNFEYFCFFLLNSFSQAAVTFEGQNYGAGQFDRCRRILRLCMGEAMLGVLLLSGIFLLGRNLFVPLYTTEPAEIEYAVLRMVILLPLIFLACSYEITGSALRGMGHSLIPALLTVLGSVVFRLFWVYFVFPNTPTFAMLISVYPISWILTGTLVVGYYFFLRKRLYAPLPDET